MSRYLTIALALAATATSATAEPSETFRLVKGLYYDCAIASERDPAETHDLDVTYFEYGDRPEPQVNFRDPSKLISDQTGWMPKEKFVLSRIASDGQVFVWLGRSDGKTPPTIDAALEIAPKADRATLSITKFVEESGAVSAQKFRGECEMTSGKAAWDRFQNGGTK